MNWNNISTWSYYTMTALTIVVQTVTLIKIIKSGKYKAFAKIISIFLLANISGLVGWFP
jgi:hypothetical protein